ncbi:polymer-forming cytoskeletal protein [Ascidiimonas sp. W6]|uniref:polymer-forming cytoskeletal protein n=1 Tax=Ascidiimonas meishanensis TaxID=3128903 RepID=UPI0030EE561A
MKTIAILLISLCSIVSFGQTVNEGDILINKIQSDDTYRSGETIKVNSVVNGDLVIAGANLIISDSINGDLTAAGGELFLNSYIADDVRIAVGKVTIDSEIGDDLVVFGGEVILTENAIIQGNLIGFAGNIEIHGEVIGKLEIKGADVLINGTIRETSKIIGEEITIGSNAKFHKEVEYWNSDGEIDFRNSLISTKAQFNEDLGEEKSELSLTTFGTTSFSLWLFYILSAFLVILVLHGLFKNTFSTAAEVMENNWLKSFGFGLIYLIGIPLLIILALVMIIGIPLGIFAMVIFIFSLLFGHLIAALLLVYYFKYKKEKNWDFWSVTLLALVCAIILRLLTIIPIAGILLSVVILSITYGALTLKVIHSKKIAH